MGRVQKQGARTDQPSQKVCKGPIADPRKRFSELFRANVVYAQQAYAAGDARPGRRRGRGERRACQSPRQARAGPVQSRISSPAAIPKASDRNGRRRPQGYACVARNTWAGTWEKRYWKRRRFLGPR
jgi:hypothetical protein